MSGKQDDRLREQCHAERATASAAGDSQRGGRLRRLRDRLRAWWRNPSIMRAFFVYALVWLVAASAVTLIAIDALMEVYYRVSEEHRSEHVEVNAGPYIYDAQTDELLRATPVYLQDFYEQVVFVAFTNSAQSYSSAGVVAGGWNRDMQVVDATMELLRSDPSYRVSDWGGNYTENDYLQTDGTPYDPEATVSVSDLPAYDARERAERLQTVEEFANTNLGEDVVLSNVAYYVSLDEASYLTWIDWTLRLVAGVGVPIVAFGGLAVLLFRRFYRRHIGARFPCWRRRPIGLHGRTSIFRLALCAGASWGASERRWRACGLRCSPPSASYGARPRTAGVLTPRSPTICARR